jgi:3-oxoacyl-[acyl-carrier-protein] synthase II
MSRIFVAGLGAVSPAGWNVGTLREALDKGEPLPIQSLPRPGWEKPLRARLVPNPVARPEFLSHPRLRRTSPITHYTASAALEAVVNLRNRGEAKNSRLGIVVCLQSGCVQYSCRFYEETLKDPATASPLVFPETVYAAPASHVAALLGNVALACSLVGDPSAFLQGVALAAQWLAENRVDACLVIGAEETNWITTDALWHLDRPAVISAGAGALCLCRESELSVGVELAAITDAHTYSTGLNRMQAAAAMRNQLGEFDCRARREECSPERLVTSSPTKKVKPGKNSPKELLCDGTGNNSRTDAAEQAAWRDWTGPRVSPKRILGEGLMAAAAWQCVAACDAVANGRFAAASVSLVGSNQQAMGARFTGISRLSVGKS